MKKIIIIFSLLLCIYTNAQIAKTEIVATGLTCSMCSNAINKQLKKLTEVEKVDVDLNTNTFTIYLKNNNTINPKTLKESIQKAGFFVGSMVVFFESDFNLSQNYILIDNQKGGKYKILDKGYMPTKEFKKQLKLYPKIPSFLINNEDDFHLKAI